MSPQSLFPRKPTIRFYPEVEICPLCGAKLKVHKTQPTTVVTLDIGAFTAKETRLYCHCHDAVYSSSELRALAPERGTFGFDIIVHVGRALFVRSLGVQEVVDELRQRNISISKSEVAFLGKKFIAYLAHAHREAREDIRRGMRKRGGYILHVDGTCEGSSPNLFCGLDELSNLVLDSVKIPSEKRELLLPFFKQWIFDAPSDAAGYGFPFDNPHLAFFQRIKAAHGGLKRIMDIRLRDNFRDNKPLCRLWYLLDKVAGDKKLAGAAASMEEKIRVFDELRQALRIALPDGKDGLNDDGTNDDITTIESAVKAFRQRVMSDDRLTANTDYLGMIAQIDKYWHLLFADPITVQTPTGPIEIIPQRTNNILERFFRDLKRGCRKKTGASNLTKMLTSLLADTPLIANLKSEQYLNAILGNCKSLEQRFSQIDTALVREYLASQKSQPQKFAAKITPLIKQKNLPDALLQMFKQAKVS